MVGVVPAYRKMVLEESYLKKLKVENRQLRQWKHQLSLILKFGQKMNTNLNTESLLELIADKTRELLRAERCSLFLLDKEKQLLWSKVAHGMGGKKFNLTLDKGLAGYVATTGKVVNVRDAYANPRFNPELDKKTDFRTRTVLCLPMKNHLGEVIGVFQVLNKRGGLFTPPDRNLLQIFSSQAAAAIENSQLYENLKESFDSFVWTLAATIDARDPMTAGHSRRVTEYSLAIAKQLGIGKEKLELLKYASILHDLGKIGVQEAVLTKPGRLSKQEYKHIQTHAALTRKILERANFQRHLKEIPQVASSHHERVDGEGYPENLKGEDIPYLSRIMAIADVFDAITSRRHYRDAMPIKQALSLIKEGTGTHFDPVCVEGFMKIPLNKLIKIIKSDVVSHFKEEDLKLLSNYKTSQFLEMLKKENSSLSAEQRKAITGFNRYYNRQIEKQINNKEKGGKMGKFA